MLTCIECGFDFDQRDPRAGVFEGRPDLSRCPACYMLESGRTGWAVWNDCNGIFGCSVRETKESAQERLHTAGYFDPASETVAPVVIVYGKPFVSEPRWDHR